jgi:hypothetical protein
MPREKLKEALDSIDWKKNVSDFLGTADIPGAIAQANLRLAIWSKQFENSDRGNPALSFVREMQVAGFNVAALTGLALYKPAAAAMRTIFETALYYTYFRTHLSELTTLTRNPDYYVQKSDLLEYHKIHSAMFGILQARFGLIQKINTWYRFVSSITHGQIPGIWIEHKSMGEIKHSRILLEQVTNTFCSGEEIVHQLFLCTVGRDLWDGFSSLAKKKLIAGTDAETRRALKMDKA